MSDGTDQEVEDLDGPICESWFLATNRTPGWLEWGKVCPHESCWAIMCFNSGNVSGWFQEQYFDMSSWGGKHVLVKSEEEECKACWSCSWPKKCPDPECNGFVHAEFEDESYDGYWLSYRCSWCGSTDSPE
jgi:hypothetical protein